MLFQNSDKNLPLKNSRLAWGCICLLSWTICHKEEDLWLQILMESLSGCSMECDVEVS